YISLGASGDFVVGIPGRHWIETGGGFQSESVAGLGWNMPRRCSVAGTKIGTKSPPTPRLWIIQRIGLPCVGTAQTVAGPNRAANVRDFVAADAALATSRTCQIPANLRKWLAFDSTQYRPMNKTLSATGFLTPLQTFQTRFKSDKNVTDGLNNPSSPGDFPSRTTWQVTQFKRLNSCYKNALKKSFK
ncbi:hypothetical protein, partial [Methylomonas sp. LWB]|uniref:hypothetical protein n=1 Tax=Methylomonas sp. LWB TaxID=1905845 RepID=UPI001C31355F